MKGKCRCGPANFFWWVVQAVAYAVGLYFVVAGVQMQWAGALWYNAVLWSSIGFFIFGFGRMAKWLSHQNCPVHQY